jgi:putative transposase
MSDTYTEIYYHLIWVTKLREAMITPEIEPILYINWKASCRDLGVTIHALNAMPDHVHLACTLPTTLAVANLVQKLKGNSAHLINHLSGERHALAWQPGYGALTFAKNDLPRVVAYVQNQQRHHQSGQLSEKMERTHTPRP